MMRRWLVGPALAFFTVASLLGAACEEDEDGNGPDAQETVEEGIEDIGEGIEEGAEEIGEGFEEGADEFTDPFETPETAE